MATQSKSVLIPFLVIAGIIFAVALGWKLLHNDEQPIKSVTREMAQENTKTEPKAMKKPQTVSEIEVIDYDEPEPLAPVIEETPEKLREIAVDKMKFAMRYPTIEKSIAALKSFRESGLDDKAEHLIRYINSQFPNESIPAELLD